MTAFDSIVGSLVLFGVAFGAPAIAIWLADRQLKAEKAKKNVKQEGTTRQTPCQEESSQAIQKARRNDPLTKGQDVREGDC